MAYRPYGAGLTQNCSWGHGVKFRSNGIISQKNHSGDTHVNERIKMKTTVNVLVQVLKTNPSCSDMMYTVDETHVRTLEIRTLS